MSRDQIKDVVDLWWAKARPTLEEMRALVRDLHVALDTRSDRTSWLQDRGPAVYDHRAGLGS